MKNIPHPNTALNPMAAQLQAMLQQAVAFHQAGQLAQAQQLYEHVLKMQPDHFDCLHLLGVIAGQMNHHQRAADLIGKAIQVRPGNPAPYFNRGIAFQALQQFDAAIASFDQAIALKPNYAEAWSNRGIALQADKRLEAAVASYDKAVAIKPDFPEAWFNRGIALKELGHMEAAVASYDKAIAINPGFAEAWCDRGIALQALRQLDAAIASFDRAIASRPHYADAHSNRGNVLQDMRQWQAAIASYDKAIAVNPDYVQAHFNRGIALQKLNQLEAAVASYDKAIALKPDYAQAYSNRGSALQDLQKMEAALVSYDSAIALKPDFAEAWFNRGNALHEMNRLEEARADYDHAILLKPDYADANWNKALLKLLTGEYEEGWRLYEWRWQSAQREFFRSFAQPLWLGDAPLHGKTILLHSEQGFGDMLQFCRYAGLVAAQGATVIIETLAPLVSLLATLDGVTQVVSSIEDSGLSYDYQCPLLSLPLAFKTTLETIPSTFPYLETDASKTDYWKEKLQGMSGLRVGLVWSGGFRPNQPEHWELMNARRNMPLSCFAALNIAGIDFVSLQKGEDAQQQLKQLQESAWNGPAIADFTGELHDFSDTAALIDNLDLVISVDTSVAHLAGALGKPVWLLNRFDTCWRWLIDREDSPWYPSMRIFRQSSPGDWEGAMCRVRDALIAWHANANQTVR